MDRRLGVDHRGATAGPLSARAAASKLLTDPDSATAKPMTETITDTQPGLRPAIDDLEPADAPAAVSLTNLTKRYGEVLALDDVSLEIRSGEFLSILGPSGSGKTTTMRMIGGFERPDSGTVEIAGRDVIDLPPYRRDVNTVFQSYALFPHMNVEDNVGYGLKVKGVGRRERRARAAEMLELVQLPRASHRYPPQLSGGMKQRVALARALVNHPSVLLLDEPLGALDRKLREDMQVELRRIQTTVGITFVYVTHDQEEALSMSDRIVVMRDGRIEQIGGTGAVYDSPSSLWVADFVGTSSCLPGTVAEVRDSFLLQTDVAPILAGYGSAELTAGQRAVAVIRPEAVRVAVADDPERPIGDGPIPNHVGAVVEEILNMGAQAKVVARTPGGTELVARVHRAELDPKIGAGTAVTMSFPATAVRVYAPDPGATAAPVDGEAAAA
jgi:spermidine/putrescine transport system ATP-binding protein